MDTSSDAEYEHEFGTPSAQIRRAIVAPPPQSLVTTPLSMSHFSRSRAPSPPSAQPRTPRRDSLFGRQNHIQLDLINQALGETAMVTPFPAEPPREISVTPAPRNDSSGSPATNIEYTICNSENGRLVVFIDSSDDESSESDIGYDGDTDGPESSSLINGLDQLDTDSVFAKERALRKEVRMLNSECRRLVLQSNSGPVSRAASFSSLVRLNASANAAAALVKPKLDDSTEKPPNGALLEAKISLKAKEEAIAQLKLEISRKQTRMLLRKKLLESRRLTSTVRPTLPKVASAPSSPLSAEAVASTSNAEKEKASLSASVSPGPTPICTPTPTRELITGDSLVSSLGDQLADPPGESDIAN
ncbi:hypothetical protein J3B02_005400, partial [Coemansia erecta]